MTSITKRVFTTDAIADIAPVFSHDSWGMAWGNAWGRAWSFASPLIPGTDTKPALNVTARVAHVTNGVGAISARVQGAEIDFGIRLYWGEQEMLWGRGRNQLKIRHTVRVQR